MIILCHKALAGVSTFERQFLTDYLINGGVIIDHMAPRDRRLVAVQK
jgi:hypothetical protein